ncbi:MAG: cell division protein ZapD, partial [Betaproteobacteria bacterium]|nr:cell division protein ZapD [Betaproteobacteria bacterium]
LEHLFFRLGELMGRSSATDHHFAITTVFEIIEVGARAELKTDVLKDLEKQKHLLAAYRGNPAISEKALDQVIGQLDACFAALKDQPGKLGSTLSEIDWLMSLRSRAAIPGGTCEFDLPAYHAWQHHTPAARQANLYAWSQHFSPLATSIQLMLKMLRESGSTQKVMATGGQLQQNLPQGRNFQLLRLRMDDSLNLTPEISCNRLLVVIRLMQQQEDGKLLASKEDTPFEMTLCA